MRSGRAALVMVAAASAAATAVTIVLRSRPVQGLPTLVLVVGSPYLAVLSLAALAIAVSLRQVTLSVVVALIATAAVGVQISWYYVPHRPDFGPTVLVRVLSANLRLGNADAANFVRLAAEEADVITAAELTPQAAQRLLEAGISRTFPFSTLLPQAGAIGIGIWSRYPLIAEPVPRHRSMATPVVRLRVPGVRMNPVLASIHLDSPVADSSDNVGEWHGGLAAGKSQLERFAELGGPAAVIVGGDFNATPDIRQFRDLLSDGYRDAVNQAGAGFAPTFPAETWLPPLITIDHVLTRNADAASVRTVSIKGSDHRGLLVAVRVPQDAQRR